MGHLGRGKFFESEFEEYFIELLQGVGWVYQTGNDVEREKLTDVIIKDDLREFLENNNQDLDDEKINAIINKVCFVGDKDDFATLHKMYNYLESGMRIVTNNNQSKIVKLIDFENPDANIFKAVNQLKINYQNNGVTKHRIPDVLLYLNGIPVCIIELKNPTDEKATIHDAYEQITIRYWRDIPHLLHYTPLACISDGANARLGTVKTPYEHFYAWRKINDQDEASDLKIERECNICEAMQKDTHKKKKELDCMIEGVYAPARFLEIFRDYVYFQDEKYDFENKEVVCRYPQFFASRRLKKSIIKSIKEKSNKGGTYFGATGCGKTYTMLFLSRQLSQRCEEVKEIGSPTIILIVDREELQKQGESLFTKSEEFLQIGEVSRVNSRKELREKISARKSGGFFICTIQKFCDREDDKIGLINDRRNIICFSDEAHRTQIEHSNKIKFSEDVDENMKAMISKPYAKVLREAFPNATFVGFTGTPIADTYQTFGDEIDRYTMDQAVADNITLPIKYHQRIAKVLLDDSKIKEIEEYYTKCANDGSTQAQILASKKAMSSLDVVLGDLNRLDRLAEDIHDHYLKSCENNPNRVQKAMVVCSNRKIAYNLLLKFKGKYPEWFEEKKTPDDSKCNKEELKRLRDMPLIAMVSSVGANDEAEMYNYLGGVNNHKRSSELDAMFKDENSNFRMAIVVDMWITGFDVPSLTFLYNDKPIKKHMLIQTLSRVNRKYKDKEYGLIIDYIGIRDNMLEAMKLYGGDNQIAPSKDHIEMSKTIFRDQLEILIRILGEYDVRSFLNTESASERYKFILEASEYILDSTEKLNVEREGKTTQVSFKKYYLHNVSVMKKAFDLCQSSGELEDEEEKMAEVFMSIASYIRKCSGTTEVDAEVMNSHVSKMLEEALKCSKVEDVLGIQEENIFTDDFIKNIQNIPMPTTRFELLVKLLKKAIAEFGNANPMESKKFEQMLKDTVDEYHVRRGQISQQEAEEIQKEAIDKLLKMMTEELVRIYEQLKESKDSHKKMGLSFEEKGIYDILMGVKDKYNFPYGVDEQVDGIVQNKVCKKLACEIKTIMDESIIKPDWINNSVVKGKLEFSISKIMCKNKYPPTYNNEVIKDVVEFVGKCETISD